MWRLFKRPKPVTEMASEVREGLENLASAWLTHAAVMASIAASSHTKNASDQRDMAGVIFADAQQRFGDVLRKLEPKKRAELENFIAGLCKTKR